MVTIIDAIVTCPLISSLFWKILLKSHRRITIELSVKAKVLKRGSQRLLTDAGELLMILWRASHPCSCEWPWLNPAGHKQKHKPSRCEVEGSLTRRLVRTGGWYQTTEGSYVWAECRGAMCPWMQLSENKSIFKKGVCGHYWALSWTTDRTWDYPGQIVAWGHPGIEVSSGLSPKVPVVPIFPVEGAPCMPSTIQNTATPCQQWADPWWCCEWREGLWETRLQSFKYLSSCTGCDAPCPLRSKSPLSCLGF